MPPRCQDVVTVEFFDTGWGYTRTAPDGTVQRQDRGPYGDQRRAHKIAQLAHPDVHQFFIARPPEGAPIQHDNGDIVEAGHDGKPSDAVIVPGDGPLPHGVIPKVG